VKRLRNEFSFEGRRLFLSGREVSRRNEVFLAEDVSGGRFVIKRYRQSSMETELDMLRRLKTAGVAVPYILGVSENAVLLSFIPGENLCGLLERCEEENNGGLWTKACLLAASWLSAYYRAFDLPVLRGDVNLRNFIVSPDAKTLCGVDFETCDEGLREEDAGRMAAFVLTYSPPFTGFKRNAAIALSEALRAEFPLDREAVRRAFQDELGRIKERRGLEIPPEAYSLL